MGFSRHGNEVVTVEVQQRSGKEGRGEVVHKADKGKNNMDGTGEYNNRERRSSVENNTRERRLSVENNSRERRLSIDADPAWIAHTQK